MRLKIEITTSLCRCGRLRDAVDFDFWPHFWNNKIEYPHSLRYANKSANTNLSPTRFASEIAKPHFLSRNLVAEELATPVKIREALERWGPRASSIWGLALREFATSSPRYRNIPGIWALFHKNVSRKILFFAPGDQFSPSEKSLPSSEKNLLPPVSEFSSPCREPDQFWMRKKALPSPISNRSP